MWMSPFAYGGPSCSTNRFAPGRAAFCATSRWKIACSSHAARISGSRCGQVRLHREVGLREVDGVLVVHVALSLGKDSGSSSAGGPDQRTSGSAPGARRCGPRRAANLPAPHAAPEKNGARSARAKRRPRRGAAARRRDPLAQPEALLDAPARRGGEGARPRAARARHAPLQHGARPRPAADPLPRARSPVASDVARRHPAHRRVDHRLRPLGREPVRHDGRAGPEHRGPHRPLARQAARAPAPLALRHRHPAHGDVPLPRGGAARGGAGRRAALHHQAHPGHAGRRRHDREHRWPRCRGMLDTLWTLGQEILLQELVAESRGKDVRALVVGDRVVAAMRRTARAGRVPLEHPPRRRRRGGRRSSASSPRRR